MKRLAVALMLGAVCIQQVAARAADWPTRPIRIIAPDRDHSDTLEFDPAKIRAAIDAGRRAVTDDWNELERFVA